MTILNLSQNLAKRRTEGAPQRRKGCFPRTHARAWPGGALNQALDNSAEVAAIPLFERGPAKSKYNQRRRSGRLGLAISGIVLAGARGSKRQSATAGELSRNAVWRFYFSSDAANAPMAWK